MYSIILSVTKPNVIFWIFPWIYLIAKGRYAVKRPFKIDSFFFIRKLTSGEETTVLQISLYIVVTSTKTFIIEMKT